MSALSKIYAEAQPFPHIVLTTEHGVLPVLFPGINELAEEALAEWPDTMALADRVYDNALEKKIMVSNPDKFPPSIRGLVDLMNGPEFVRFLSDLTGIKDLLPDHELVGGGLHEIPPGGKLGMHIDFAKHSKRPLFRRVNALLYLNKNWLEAWGGHLELYNKQTGDHLRVRPAFGRLVVFSTTAESWHGHPEPLACPVGHSRKSVALYYYTEAAGGSIYNDDTEFM